MLNYLPNKYPNIFRCHIIYQKNIPIFLDATTLPQEYPNILYSRNGTNTNMNNIRRPFYSNIQIFIVITVCINLVKWLTHDVL